MRDVYANPTVRRLARALDAARPAAAEASRSEPPTARRTWPITAAAPRRRRSTHSFGAWRSPAVKRRSIGSTKPSILRSSSMDGRCSSPLSGFSATTRSPWRRSGCWSAGSAPRAIPLWSFAYFRFWAASSWCARRPPTPSPERRCSTLYLRLLGARIGRNAVIAYSDRPGCGRSFRGRRGCGRDAQRLLPGYVAYGNRIHIGRIRIGRNAYVGEQSVLDIRSTIGDFGQLGHASSLQSGQRVPEGKRYAGSPAEETTTSFRLADEAPVSPAAARAVHRRAGSPSSSPSPAR